MYRGIYIFTHSCVRAHTLVVESTGGKATRRAARRAPCQLTTGVTAVGDCGCQPREAPCHGAVQRDQLRTWHAGPLCIVLRVSAMALKGSMTAGQRVPIGHLTRVVVLVTRLTLSKGGSARGGNSFDLRSFLERISTS